MCIDPIEACSPVKVIKNRTPVTCLATMTNVYAACAVCVTIFSIGSKCDQFQMELHALTLVTCSYALLTTQLDGTVLGF